MANLWDKNTEFLNEEVSQDYISQDLIQSSQLSESDKITYSLVDDEKNYESENSDKTIVETDDEIEPLNSQENENLQLTIDAIKSERAERITADQKNNSRVETLAEKHKMREFVNQFHIQESEEYITLSDIYYNFYLEYMKDFNSSPIDFKSFCKTFQSLICFKSKRIYLKKKPNEKNFQELVFFT